MAVIGNARNVCTVIAGGFTRLERLRPNNIPHAISSEKQGTGHLLLRISSNIRADNDQTHAESQTLEIAEPEGNQTAPFIRVREAHQQSGPEDTGQIGKDHARAA